VFVCVDCPEKATKKICPILRQQEVVFGSDFMADDKKEGEKGFFGSFFKKVENKEEQRMAQDFLKEIAIGPSNAFTIGEKRAWVEHKLNVIRVMLGTAKEDVKTKVKAYDVLQLNTATINLLKTEKADLKQMEQELHSLFYDFQGQQAEWNPTQRRKVEELTLAISKGPKPSVEKPVDWYEEAFVKLNKAYRHKDFNEVSSYFGKSFQQAQITVTTEISSLMKAERGEVQISESSSDESKEQSEEKKGPQGPT
jgi:hypothetical protein